MKNPSADDKRWQAMADLSTLCEARKIEKDEKRMKAVRELAKSKMSEMAALAADDD